MKNIRHLIILSFLLVKLVAVNSQTVTIDGNVFLENQSHYDSIKILFERTVPSSFFDSIYSDTSGHFSIVIETGIYNIYYSKENYISISLIDQLLYSNITLPDTTLQNAGLNGQLSGTLISGNYTVGANIEVSSNDTLIIEPGTKLFFKQDIEFNIYGLLISVGTINDSIIFTRYESGVTWGGLNFYGSPSNQNGILSYCLIEYANSCGIKSYSSPEINNSIIRNNSTSSSTSPFKGGGIDFDGSNSIVNNVLIENNNSIWGGGISSSGNPVLSNIIIRVCI